MSKELTDTEKKRLVARVLLGEAGTLVEFWSEKAADRMEPEEAEQIDGEFARQCLASWLKRLPGDDWDIRLGDI